MTLDRKFLVWGLVYAVIGMAIGIYMAASKNHSLFVAHAHILLVGFVVSLIYGLIHKLWVAAEHSAVARVQFYLHQLSAAVMGIGLLLFYSDIMKTVLDPVLAASSIGVLIGALLMILLVLRAPR